ncbi:PREDICTED: tyrosine kinase receptor Cad96Ca isoform X2 [Trachymyrmex septentrionalis]|uniref:tyrosine kinase receptor Cad96Ca isoform X2 n=1 Tax=Trachymyrmex septentrionalis TaxID=34720 RepID=UPI00084F0118|nr:PREDICTED: tyrosine kinase receptor Cad96Ca isoform X2 [Trachymyrmex septentrionalis]
MCIRERPKNATRIEESQLSDNTPPIIGLDYRNWKLSETEPVGNVITRVHAKDNEQDDLIYGLERLEDYNGDNKPQSPLPFFINNRTGIIFLNETLKGRAGQDLSFYVTVFDGHVKVKLGVYVNIEHESTMNRARIRVPYLNQPNSGSGIRPPFLPNLSSFPSPPLPPLPPKQYHPQTTKLELERIKPKENDNSVNSNTISTISTVSTEESVRINEVESPALSSKVAPSAAPPSQDMAMTLVPIAAGCALVVGLGLGAWSLRNKFCSNRKSKKGQTSVSVSNLSDEPSLVLKRWRGPKTRNNRYQPWEKEFQAGIQSKQEDKWEFPRHRLKVFNILGEGCFGQVWKCEALGIDGKSGPTIVAVKTLKENAAERERLDLAQELRVMKNLDPHPNVVRLLGCCTEREPMFVILEYVSGGKLQSFLRASREERNHGGAGLTSRDLTGFVYQIAKGMEYLASKGIIHRDLAARNILIDENRACKVADFGFARDVAANQIYERKSEGRLPIRWMAPESLYDNIFSVKSDIWSFGVLIWEIVTLGSTPYPGLAAAEVMRKIKEGYRLDRPEHCKRELYNIMYYCWDKDSACRPSFAELVNLTESLLLDETDYIELDRFPDHSYYNVLNLSGEKL